MKILILCIVASITFAQQSVDSVQIALHSEDVKSNYHQIMPLPTSIVELKMNRSWLRDSLTTQQVLTKSSTIKFKGASENFIDSELFYIIVGSAVAFGAAAAYFKLESDDYYEEYLLTNDSSLKKKTDRYDLYSGIALGAMEINIGILIYKFLTD
ncbi:MAG: hypothetical protein R3250_03840 [Melioribacteraceae bacterium]|nr:hypothetical protein [Melioribacteraceae bacterium]